MNIFPALINLSLHTGIKKTTLIRNLYRLFERKNDCENGIIHYNGIFINFYFFRAFLLFFPLKMKVSKVKKKSLMKLHIMESNNFWKFNIWNIHFYHVIIVCSFLFIASSFLLVFSNFQMFHFFIDLFKNHVSHRYRKDHRNSKLV